MSVESRVLRKGRQAPRRCLSSWLSPCLGRSREVQQLWADGAWLDRAKAFQGGERLGGQSGSQLASGGEHQGGHLQPMRKVSPMRDAGGGALRLPGPSGRVSIRMAGQRLGERELGEIVESNGREEKLDRWQYCQGQGDRGAHMYGIRENQGTRSRLPGVSECPSAHRDLFNVRNAAGYRCAKSLKLCAMEEEQRCALVLEKVRAMRCQLGEDLKRNNVDFRTKTKEAMRSSTDAEAFCQTLLGSFAKEPDIPKDLEVMIKDCFKSCIGVHNKECMVCTRGFTAKDLLTCKTSNRCRHSLYPCGHSVLCGDCAEVLWKTTKKCPMCRSLMTKRPKVFKPGRWQMVGPHKE